MFKSSDQYLPSSSKKLLHAPQAWNNIFRDQFVNIIDETRYSALYSSVTGRPNASIRTLLGMMVLKEMHGYTDEQLFDSCRFDMRTRSALGLYHWDDQVPCPSTYYDFRAKVAKHLEDTDEDLIEATFAQVNVIQLSSLQISGEKIRMDSKLIQSNIARHNRLQLVVEAVRTTLKGQNIKPLSPYLNDIQLGYLAQLATKSTSNITYQLNKAQKQAMLIDFGIILVAMYESGMIDKQDTLYKILKEQYEYEEDQDQPPTPRPPDQIGSDTIQSIHDTDATHRKKGRGRHIQNIQGYHTNITETCSPENPINLITNVITAPANISEAQFLVPAIESTQTNLGNQNPIKETITDGGYDSITNRDSLSEPNAPSWKMPKLKGSKHVYDIHYDEHEQLHVQDIKTGQPCQVTWSTSAEKYRITKPNGTSCYKTQEQINSYITSQQILKQTTKENYNQRASVESTIHEVFHRLLQRSKTKYRGLTKHHWYALSRALAVNMGRITRYSLEMGLELAFLLLTALLDRHIRQYPKSVAH